MSHFTVLVVTDEEPTEEVLTAALLPFHEYECTGIEEYTQFVLADMTEAQAEFEERREKFDYQTIDQFMTEWYGYTQNETGQWGRKTNPNKKWDWWTVGGRWGGMFTSQRGIRCDQIRKDDLDMEKMAEQRRQRRVAAWEELEQRDGGGDSFLRTFVYGIPADMDKETYINTDPGFSTFAVLYNGNWAEKGEMGWFACVSNEKADWPEQFKAIFDSLPDTAWLSVVDCHI